MNDRVRPEPGNVNMKNVIKLNSTTIKIGGPRKAFTLLEIMVVLAIIGLLVGLAVASLDKIYLQARISAAELFVRQSIKLPLQSYRWNMGDFPSTGEGFQALVSPPAGKADRWRGPYLEGGKLPLDPWGEPYQYRCPGTHKNEYDIWSKGPDKADGTDDDIVNWTQPKT